VSTPDSALQERVRELCERYAAAVQKMSDESLTGAHQRYARYQVQDLLEITRAELERRGLSAHLKNFSISN